MNLRILLSAVALPLLLAGTAQAGGGTVRQPAAAPDGGFSFSLPTLRLPGMPPRTEERPVELAQAGDPRVAQLEEQVRQLTGTLEELNFQILQMQDQLRRMQEDNELRFQELEGGQRSGAAPRPATDDNAAVAPDSGGNVAVAQPPAVEDGSQVLGQPPRNFGTITFDANGNVSGGGVAEQPAASAQPPSDGTTVAALPPANDADELYRNSYEFILSGDYATAEAGFRDLIERFPDNAHQADAHFWLGEALLAQQKPREAAETFLAASRDFPDSEKAPDTLFKLGVSLAAMKQRDVACATFAEVGQRYPQASDALKERVRQEQALASC